MSSSSYTISRSNSVPDIHHHLNTSVNNKGGLLIDAFSISRDRISNSDDENNNDEADDDKEDTMNEISQFNKMRRHSSQSLIITSHNERICSSPINALKMSTRVCQIKIDEGIEPHVIRELKSEREIQNALKLKSSYDELLVFDNETEQQNQITSSSTTTTTTNTQTTQSTSKFRRYRTFSETVNSNTSIPSPLSPSYSNSSSPTSCFGLLRCISPSLTNAIPISSNNNTFSPSPSPTRKLFITRRSMSPNNCQLKPSALNVSTKRKFSDIDNDTSINVHSPKQAKTNNSNVNNQFAHPLVVNTSLSTKMVSNDFQSPSTININKSNNYTFMPIQPQSLSVNNKLSRPNNINFLTTNQSPMNSPANIATCDSPSSSSIISNSEKPDSGYQSSVQNNSDSESCQ